MFARAFADGYGEARAKTLDTTKTGHDSPRKVCHSVSNNTIYTFYRYLRKKRIDAKLSNKKELHITAHIFILDVHMQTYMTPIQGRYYYPSQRHVEYVQRYLIICTSVHTNLLFFEYIVYIL